MLFIIIQLNNIKLIMNPEKLIDRIIIQTEKVINSMIFSLKVITEYNYQILTSMIIFQLESDLINIKFNHLKHMEVLFIWHYHMIWNHLLKNWLISSTQMLVKVNHLKLFTIKSWTKLYLYHNIHADKNTLKIISITPWFNY